MTETRVLIVDDDAVLLQALPEALRLRMDDLAVDTSGSATEALERIAAMDYDAIISDIKMPGMDGLALLGEIRKIRPTTPTLLITGHGEHDLAVQALRGGAYDFIQKPIDRDYFVASLARAIQMRRLDRQIDEQKRALERHARVLEHVGDGVVLVDRDGTIRLWNRAAEAITGLPVDSVLGRRSEDVLPGWNAVAERLSVSQAPGSANGRAETFPFELDGRDVWLSITAVGSADGIVYAFRDVTSEHTVDQLKADFVATASHELRTPLAAIYGAAITLRRRDIALDDANRERMLQMITDEAEQLARIVGDLLVASRLDSGELEFANESFDVVELTRDIVESMSVHLPDNVEMKLVGPPSLPPIAADPGRVRQVLLNLLDNAVKYSPDGGPIEVKVEGRSRSVFFSVRDEGLGIPAGEQVEIFKKFYRLDPNLTGGVSGTGLGLYICDELVRRMDGRIWVESREGEGSTFFVELPVQGVDGGPAARN
jgi:PAS domain S-box-containing protein